ncbi:MAG: protein phosphatase CheZ [Nitrospira sp.]|nr:protein phosphatase CheZ [Nitrospira sp.]
MQNGKHKLYDQLGELARFVETALRTLNQASVPIAASSSELPAVASHLAELNKMTEEGTLEVMRLTDLIQDNHGQTMKELTEIREVLKAVDCTTLAHRIQTTADNLKQDDQLFMQIMTALSFQDLVAQRVKKLVGILNDVQDKLMKLVVVFGPKADEDPGGTDSKSDELLKQLEESKTMAMKQNVADEILAQYGFK